MQWSFFKLALGLDLNYIQFVDIYIKKSVKFKTDETKN